MLVAKSIINAPEGILMWRDKELPLISYTFKDHITIQFIDWESICLPVENCELLVELLQRNSDVFSKG